MTWIFQDRFSSRTSYMDGISAFSLVSAYECVRLCVSDILIDRCELETILTCLTSGRYGTESNVGISTHRDHQTYIIELSIWPHYCLLFTLLKHLKQELFINCMFTSCWTNHRLIWNIPLFRYSWSKRCISTKEGPVFFIHQWESTHSSNSYPVVFLVYVCPHTAFP